MLASILFRIKHGAMLSKDGDAELGFFGILYHKKSVCQDLLLKLSVVNYPTLIALAIEYGLPN
jgi:hypothetical protein